MMRPNRCLGPSSFRSTMPSNPVQPMGTASGSSRCWASCLGGCSNKMSREHTITKAMFLDKEIEVSGMPWCVDQPKKVGLANLTAKVLCVVHNSALSPVDQEALRFAEAMRESFRLLAVRHRLKQKRWTLKKFPIDGPRIERWFLKTLINAACHRGSRIGVDSHHAGLPSQSLVEIAFGKRTFEPIAGLYGIYDPQRKGKAGMEYPCTPSTLQGIVCWGQFSLSWASDSFFFLIRRDQIYR
jgi:hypothetical protein